MNFKAKLSKQGNSYCIYVPKDVRTNLDLEKEYEWSVRTDVITEDNDTPQKLPNVITKEIKEPQRNWQWCNKHSTSKINCKCN